MGLLGYEAADTAAKEAALDGDLTSDGALGDTFAPVFFALARRMDQYTG
jgi:hypothetical protein